MFSSIGGTGKPYGSAILEEARSSASDDPVAAEPADEQAQPGAALMSALGMEYGMLQSARGATISESSSRSSLFLTTLSGAVVGLSFVAQASHFGQTFYIFALAIMPVVFFLGLVTYYRVLQTGVEDVIYARAIAKIRAFYSEIDPPRASLFHASSLDQVGLASLGLFKLWWQQFLSAAALVAIVNSVVGGVFIALTVTYLFQPPPLAAIGVGAAAVLLLCLGFLRHQWSTWTRVRTMLPLATTELQKGRAKA